MSFLDRIRQRDPGSSVLHILWWDFCRFLVWIPVWLLYSHRWWGHRNIPKKGPVLLVCNHQSFLDLIVLGVGMTHRQFYGMARSGLFESWFFGNLLRTLKAFPVEQGKGDVGALRQAIDVLKKDRLLLVFPEGQRTDTGRLGPFQEGIMLLIRRAKPMVVPMAVDGVYDIWPRKRKLPRLRGRTGAIYGEPIPAEQLLAMSPADATALLRERVETLRLELRGKLRHRTYGRYPKPGPGDVPVWELEGKEEEVTAGMPGSPPPPEGG